jgi:hypothetical protein
MAISGFGLTAILAVSVLIALKSFKIIHLLKKGDVEIGFVVLTTIPYVAYFMQAPLEPGYLLLLAPIALITVGKLTSRTAAAGLICVLLISPAVVPVYEFDSDYRTPDITTNYQQRTEQMDSLSTATNSIYADPESKPIVVAGVDSISIIYYFSQVAGRPDIPVYYSLSKDESNDVFADNTTVYYTHSGNSYAEINLKKKNATLIEMWYG